MSDPTTIPLPPGTVEAVAKAIYEEAVTLMGAEYYRVWNQACESDRERFTDVARAAIAAYESAKAGRVG